MVGSLFTVGVGEMNEALCTELPLDINALEQSLLGMDCEDSRFGRLLCGRLGYTQLTVGRWEGSEESGLTREVSLVVKCPPKPMLPDYTRVVIRHRMQRQHGTLLLLEREIGTLDIPYGDSFRVQERWIATAGGGAGAEGAPAAVELRVLTHVHFKGRVGLMGSKIRQHSSKKSRKVASLATELLMQADQEEAAAAAHTLFASPSAGESPTGESAKPDGGEHALADAEGYGGAGGGHGAGGAGGAAAALAELREKYDGLFEEAAYFKRRCAQLERENARLEGASKLTRRTKTEQVDMVALLEKQLQRERYERAAMEELLTTAYNETIRQIIESPPSPEGQARAPLSPTGTTAAARPPPLPSPSKYRI